MRSPSEADGRRGRLLRAIALILAGAAAIFLILLAPDLYGLLPLRIRQHRIATVLFLLAAAYGIASARGRRSPARLLDRADAIAGAALDGGLTIVMAAVCVIFLATWLPHYILWPWGRDTDTFATLAQSWDAGIRPYRDIRGYNFPGAIYLHWLIGKAFGWGRPWAIYAVDASGLLLLGAALAAWSRRCLGGMFPGLVSYLVFLGFYLSCDFMKVAQRDWHASLCIVLGLLILQAWPGRASRIASAILAATAVATRPHAIVFLPALASAVLEGGDPSGPRLRWRWLAEWLLVLGIATGLMFLPLLIAGILDDLIRGLRIAAYGGPYSRATPGIAIQVLVEQCREPRNAIAMAMLVVVVAATRGAERRRAITWATAMLAAMAYRPFHPVQHGYLVFPLTLVSSVALAPPMAWIAGRVAVPPPLRVAMLTLLIVEVDATWPAFCSPSGTVASLSMLAAGRTLADVEPPGSAGWFYSTSARWYSWDSYRDTLIYLRQTTASTTQVANVLGHPPFPAINGPAGRVSPFLAESGICWMWLVDMDLDPEFTAALESSTDSVVVWAPSELPPERPLKLTRLLAVIPKYYRPAARFGRIEVWRRAEVAP